MAMTVPSTSTASSVYGICTLLVRFIISECQICFYLLLWIVNTNKSFSWDFDPIQTKLVSFQYIPWMVGDLKQKQSSILIWQPEFLDIKWEPFLFIKNNAYSQLQNKGREIFCFLFIAMFLFCCFFFFIHL